MGAPTFLVDDRVELLSLTCRFERCNASVVRTPAGMVAYMVSQRLIGYCIVQSSLLWSLTP